MPVFRRKLMNIMQSDPSDIILYWLQILSGGYFIDKINFNYSYRLKTLKRKFGLAIQPTTIYYYLWLPSYARGKKISTLFSFFPARWREWTVTVHPFNPSPNSRLSKTMDVVVFSKTKTHIFSDPEKWLGQVTMYTSDKNEGNFLDLYASCSSWS